MEKNDDISEEVSSSDSEPEEKSVNLINNKKGTHLNTIRSKIKIIKYAKFHNQKNASIKYSMPESTISDWMKNEKNI